MYIHTDRLTDIHTYTHTNGESMDGWIDEQSQPDIIPRKLKESNTVSRFSDFNM